MIIIISSSSSSSSSCSSSTRDEAGGRLSYYTAYTPNLPTNIVPTKIV